MRKRVFTAIICIYMILFFCSCNSFNHDLESDFLSYYSDVFDKFIFHTPNGTEMYVVSLEKENMNSNPKIILTLIVGESDEELQYQWLKQSPEERKTDLQYCSNLVIDFAKASAMENDYYLYIVVHETGDQYFCDTVYDYEQDTIFISNNESTFIQMYEQFGTFIYNNIKDLPDGKDFLISNGFARLKHNELETVFTNRSYTVYIIDGEFNKGFKEESTAY